MVVSSHRCTLAIGLAAWLLSAPHVDAGFINYLTQTRTISAGLDDMANGIVVTNSLSAPDFEPFNETVTAVSPINPVGFASTSMQSTLDPLTGIFIHLSVGYQSSTNFQQLAGGMGNFLITFEVTELTFGVVTINTSDGFASISGAGGLMLPSDPLGPPNVPPTPVIFVPGLYEISGSVLAGGGGSSGADAMISVVIPSPANGSAMLLLWALVGSQRRRR